VDAGGDRHPRAQVNESCKNNASGRFRALRLIGRVDCAAPLG